MGLSGWLILPAIGLILGPPLSGVYLVQLILLLPQLQEVGPRSLIITNATGIFILFVLTIVAAYKFFRKKRSAPATIITLLIVQLALQILLIFISAITGPEELHKEYFRGAGKSIFYAGVWIMYFRESKRVKATFTK